MEGGGGGTQGSGEEVQIALHTPRNPDGEGPSRVSHAMSEETQPFPVTAPAPLTPGGQA